MKRMRGNKGFLIFHTLYLSQKTIVPRIELYTTTDLNRNEVRQYSLWHDSLSTNQIFSVLVVTSVSLPFQFASSRAVGELVQEVTIQSTFTVCVGNEGFCADNK
jgi:hypothetical protein